MAKCAVCGEEKAQYLENGRCYSCRRRHFEQTRPLMLFDLLDAETKKKIIG
jgi:hypothetical protein